MPFFGGFGNALHRSVKSRRKEEKRHPIRVGLILFFVSDLNDPERIPNISKNSRRF